MFVSFIYLSPPRPPMPYVLLHDLFYGFGLLPLLLLLGGEIARSERGRGRLTLRGGGKSRGGRYPLLVVRRRPPGAPTPALAAMASASESVFVADD